MDSPALDSNAAKYAEEIVAKANLRTIREQLQKTITEIDSAKADPQDVTAKLEQQILNTARGTEVKEFTDSATAIAQTIADIERRSNGETMSGITVDLPSLDKITGGFQRGDLIILAARPSMGKTALALNMAVNASKRYNVAFFSLEMPLVSIMNRVLGSTAFIDGHKFREPRLLTETESKKIAFAKEQIEKMNLYIDDTAGIKLSELV